LTATKSPFDTDHRIGRLDVVAAVHDLDNAMAFRPRLESLAWEKFPDVIRRVFEKFSPADAIVRVEKLELDLGTVRPAFLESDAIAALEQALEEALGSAIHEASHSQHQDRQLINTPVWRLQRMEAFLCRGTVGFSADMSGFDPTAEAIWLLDNESESFVAMIARQVHHRHALDRLFLQIDKAARERLVKRLAPSQAMDTIHLMNAMEELLTGYASSAQRISAAALRQKFWVTTVACLAKARGSPYDSKHFLTQILANLAEQANIPLPEYIASILETFLMTDQWSNRHPDVTDVLAAIQKEQGRQASGSASREFRNIAPSGIEQWRMLFHRHRSSGRSEQRLFSELTKAQYEALLQAWAPDRHIAEKSQLLARSFAQQARESGNSEDRIDRAIFEHIAAHIDKADDPPDLADLWQYVLSKFEVTSENPQLASALMKILLSDNASTESDIAATLDKAIEHGVGKNGQSSDRMGIGKMDGGQNADNDGAVVQDVTTSQQPSASVTSRDKADGDHIDSPRTKDTRSGKPKEHDSSVSLSSLQSDIFRAMASGEDEWRRLLRKHARTGEQRSRLSAILSSEKFGALLAAIFVDPAIPDILNTLISALSTALDHDVSPPMKAATIEYLAMRGDDPIEPGSFWQHLLGVVLPAGKKAKIRSRLTDILTSASPLAEEQLAAVLVEISDRRTGSPSSSASKPAPEGDGLVQDGAWEKVDGSSKRAAPEHMIFVGRLSKNPDQWRALLRTYARNPEDRAGLLAGMNASQFGSLLQAATRDAKTAATHAALITAVSKAFGNDARTRIDSALLQYLAAHDSNPVDIQALWTYCLEAIFAADVPATEKAMLSRKIFDLLPHDGDSLGPEIFHALAVAASERTAGNADQDQSDRGPLTNDENSTFIASILQSDPQLIFDKLRAAIPPLTSDNSLPIIRFDQPAFVAIVRRIKPLEIAALFDGVKALVALQRAKAFIPMSEQRLAELVQYLMIATLIWQSSGRINPGMFWQALIRHLAQASDMSADTLASRLHTGLLETHKEHRNISALESAIHALVSKTAASAPGAESTEERRQSEWSDNRDPIGPGSARTDSGPTVSMANVEKVMMAQEDGHVRHGRPFLRETGAESIIVSPPENASAARLTLAEREAVAAYLRTGERQNQQEMLARAARQDPIWLAELARITVSSTTGATVVAERLLFWLKPVQILECLAPALAGALMQEAVESSDDKSWWTGIIAGLLAGKLPSTRATQSPAREPMSETIEHPLQAGAIEDGDPVDPRPKQADGDATGGLSDADQSPRTAPHDAPYSVQSSSSPMAAASDENVPAANLLPGDREAIAAYLGTGDRRLRMDILVYAAQQYPAWLAELARESISSTSDAAVVAERLLCWLMPSEILAFLAPALAGDLMEKAPRYGNDKIWWTETIAGLLVGELPSASKAPDSSAVPHMDLLASLQEWLDGGNAPENAADHFVRLTRAERISLLRADTIDATLQKIQYAATTLGSGKTEALLQDMIGWTMLKKGPLASLIAEQKADQRTMLLRAAAANIVSTEIDLNLLADPLPEMDQADQPQGPDDPDVSATQHLTIPDLIAWLEGSPVKAEEAVQLTRQFDLLIDQQDSQLLSYISSHFYHQEPRHRWVGLLPRPSLGRLLNLIAPNDARALYDGILLVKTAGSQLLPAGGSPLDARTLWNSVFDAVAHPGKFDMAAILARLVAAAAGDDTDLQPRIRARAIALAGDAEHMTVAAALRRNVPPEAEQNIAASSEKPARNNGWAWPDAGAGWQEAEEDMSEPVYIANAGLVLVNPFLPTFLERLDLLRIDGEGKPRIEPGHAASRAVHLLQYLVTGQTATPEPLLFLNKIICGLPTGTPVASAIEPDPGDIEICDGLLAGILENWSALHGTSIDGLRETFLQREGRLDYLDQKWTLVVQRKTLDILKDQVPWNTSVIYHPWMHDAIHVTW
tara:strand:- start:22409 stop:28252 length:5844 start_codon:yes stop_codon:yes gene_type:complete